jgi:4-amino-4-deoxy-L-arabinose transferase-like glycosyltransferase
MSVRAWCALIVAAAGTFILWGLGQGHASLYVGDAVEYNQYALNLVRHGVFSNDFSTPFYPGVTRTPGYPAFLALLHLIAMHSGLLVQIVQFVLVGVIAWLVYGIALEIADVRAARISAVLSALYLPLLWFAARVGPEVLASALVTLAILLLLKARRRPSVPLWIAVGLTFAAGAYVRPEIAGLGATVVLGVLITGRGSYRSRSRLLPPAIVLAAMILALAPWMIRNTSVAHKFVPFDSELGADLLASADQYAGTFGYQTTLAQWVRLNAQTDAIARRVESQHPTAREQVAADVALTRQARRIMSRLPPGTIAKSVPRRLATLWGTADEYPEGRSWSAVAGLLGLMQYGLILVLILAGIVMHRRRLLTDWPVWVAVPYFTVLHLVSHVESRYSLAARPALLVYAGIAAAVVLTSMSRAWRAGTFVRRVRVSRT